jgi:hypothetical protein
MEFYWNHRNQHKTLSYKNIQRALQEEKKRKKQKKKEMMPWYVGRNTSSYHAHAHAHTQHWSLEIKTKGKLAGTGENKKRTNGMMDSIFCRY